MPQLEKILLDTARAEIELTEFRKFLHDNDTFSETEVVTELKKRPNLSCLIGSITSGLPRADVYKFEFQIQGAFKADLVVGSSQTRRFVLVEFEGAETNSLFGPAKTNQMRDWSRNLERGFGQLVDWAWALSDSGQTQILRNAFGCSPSVGAFVLVCGRNALMDVTEQQRFLWRSDHIVLNSRVATFLTYDDLAENVLASAIDSIKSYRRRRSKKRSAKSPNITKKKPNITKRKSRN